MAFDTQELGLGSFNRCSSPADLRITDMRVSHITGVPMNCVLIKLMTNSELVGYGEIRDWASASYGLMLKSRIIGENPCNIEKIFRRIKQFGFHGRQGGGVSGIELALWDLAGKAYGVPVYQMLGGKFRDRVRVYSDTDCADRKDGRAMGEALKKRMDLGFSFLKMDWGIENLLDEPGTLCAPSGYLDELRRASEHMNEDEPEKRDLYRRAYEVINTAHPFTALQITQKGYDLLEERLKEVRSVIGYEIPLALDHCGHIGLHECIRLTERAEKYNIAWLEDMLPWQMTEAYKRLASASPVPLCTGEDIYLKEGFRPLLESGSIAVVHPDVLTAGGILETKKIGDMASEYGAALAIHMAESPIAFMAAAHAALAAEHFLALEFHSVDVPWWEDLVNAPAKPLIRNGFAEPGDEPGLGISGLNDEVLAEHLHVRQKELWMSTDEWNAEWAHDRLWS